MSQLGFRRDGPPRPWKLEEPLTAAVIYSRVLNTINWDAGDPDIKADHQAAVVYGSGDFPDLTVGMVYILFFIRGDPAIYLATVDQAASMDTLVGPSVFWGIDTWIDPNIGDNWQQY